MTRASGSVVQPRTSTRAGTSSKKKPGISNSKTAPVDTAPDTDHLSGVSDAERVSMVTEIATRLGEGGDVDDPQRLSSSLRTLGVLLRTGSQKSKGLRRVTDALVIPALLLREDAGRGGKDSKKRKKDATGYQYLESGNADVRLYAGICCLYVLRLHAPDSPFGDDVLGLLFGGWFRGSVVGRLMDGAGGAGGAGHGRGGGTAGNGMGCTAALEACETVASMKMCLLMLDLDGADGMLVELCGAVFGLMDELAMVDETVNGAKYDEVGDHGDASNLQLGKNRGARDDGYVVRVWDALLGIVSSLVGEADYISQGLLDMVLGHLAPSSMFGSRDSRDGGMASLFAKALLRESREALQPSVQRFIRQVMDGETPAGSDLVGNASQLILRVHEASPQMMLPVMPSIVSTVDSGWRPVLQRGEGLTEFRSTRRRVSRGHVQRVPRGLEGSGQGPGYDLPWMRDEEGATGIAIDGSPAANVIHAREVVPAPGAGDEGRFSLVAAILAAADGHAGSRSGGRGRGSSREFEVSNVLARVLDAVSQDDLDRARVARETLDAFKRRVGVGGLTEDHDEDVIAAAISRVYSINVDIYEERQNMLQLQRKYSPREGQRAWASVALQCVRLHDDPVQRRYSAVVREEDARQDQEAAADRARRVRPVATRNRVSRQVVLSVDGRNQFFEWRAVRPDGRELFTALGLGVRTVTDPNGALRLRGIDSRWRPARDLLGDLNSSREGGVEQLRDDEIIQAFVDSRNYTVQTYRPERVRGGGRGPATAWRVSRTFEPVGRTGGDEDVIRIGIGESHEGQRSVIVFMSAYGRFPHAPAGGQAVVLAGAGAREEIAISHDVVHDDDDMYSALFVGFVGLENVRRARLLRGVGGHRVEVGRLREFCIQHLEDADLLVPRGEGSATHPDATFFDTNARGIREQLLSGIWARGRERFMLACFARMCNVSVHVYGGRERRERGGRVWRGPLVRTEVYPSPAHRQEAHRPEAGGPGPERVLRIGFVDGHYVALLHVPTRRPVQPPGAGPDDGAGDAPPAMDASPRARASLPEQADSAPAGDAPAGDAPAGDAPAGTTPPPVRRSKRKRKPSTFLHNGAFDVSTNGDSSQAPRQGGAGDPPPPPQDVDALVTVTEDRAEYTSIKTTLRSALNRSRLPDDVRRGIEEYFWHLVEERSYGGYWCGCLCNALVSHDDFPAEEILNDNSMFNRFIGTCYRTFVDTTGQNENPRNEDNIIRDAMWNFIDRVAQDLRGRHALPQRLPYVQMAARPHIHKTAFGLYQTNFKNHLWMNYERRLDVLLRTTDYNLQSKRDRRVVLDAIMGNREVRGHDHDDDEHNDDDHDDDEHDNPRRPVLQEEPIVALIAAERGRFQIPVRGGEPRVLQEGEPITEVILKQNLQAVFLSSRSALRTVNEYNRNLPREERHLLLRTWTLAPTSEVRRHHVELDNKALGVFIAHFGLGGVDGNDDEEGNAAVVARVFDQRGRGTGPSNRRTPTPHIATDGFSLSVLYEDRDDGVGEEEDVNAVNGEDEVEGDGLGGGEVEVEASCCPVVGDCNSAPEPTDVSAEFIQGTCADRTKAQRAGGKRKRKRGRYHGKKKKKKKKPSRVSVTRDMFPADPIVIGLDPGRTNIFYAVRMTDKKAFKLTRREYYHLSGVNDRVFQMAKLKEGLEAYHGQLSREGSLKFGTFEDLIPGLVLRVRGYQRAWELYGDNEKRAKLAFKVHGGKMRTLQAKFNEFGKGLTREEKARIVVGYGDARFPSHGPRGERAVPVSRSRRICGYTWKTLNTPESCSTVTCNDCKEPLVGVKTDIPFYTRSGEIRLKDNRGCKRCTSVHCRSNVPFKGRDKNAALNIGEITQHMLDGRPRPECFTRAYHDARRPRRGRRGRPAH